MVRVRPSSLAFATLGLVSCAAAFAAMLNGCVLGSFSLAPTPDAGHDVTMMPETGPPPGCMRATYPDPPGGMDDGIDTPGLVFAVHSIDLGDMGTTPGYDLDNVCTCFQDAGGSCVGHSSVLSSYCDAMGGIDNAGAKLFMLLALAGPTVSSMNYSKRADEGAWSFLIRVQGYNGKPDDPKVNVALYPSKGAKVKPPMWDGTDVFLAVPDSVGDGGVDDPSFKSNGAYVSGGVLVATIPNTELTITGGGSNTITIRLSAGVITGKLAQVNTLWHLQAGTLAARWPVTEVFNSLSSFRDNNGKPFCTNQVAYALAKTRICDGADILVDGTQPKSAPCDALSIGLGFSADPVVLGGVSDAGALTDGCPAATDPADPANNHCN